ncbi:MAG: TetR/AcrR family transcriptional regulator [Actinomycetota bacterium]
MTSDTSPPTGKDQQEAAMRGRPRDTERTEAILDATHKVLHSQGWHDLRVADIAREAGCGLATIYRRWGTKEELVAAAVTNRPLPPAAETGDPRTDLHNLVVAVVDEMAAMGESVIGFLAATQAEPILRDAFQKTIMTVTRPRIGGYLAAILDDDGPQTELLIDAIGGALLMRIGVLGQQPDPAEFADGILALVDRMTANS